MCGEVLLQVSARRASPLAWNQRRWAGGLQPDAHHCNKVLRSLTHNLGWVFLPN